MSESGALTWIVDSERLGELFAEGNHALVKVLHGQGSHGWPQGTLALVPAERLRDDHPNRAINVMAVAHGADPEAEMAHNITHDLGELREVLRGPVRCVHVVNDIVEIRKPEVYLKSIQDAIKAKAERLEKLMNSVILPKELLSAVDEAIAQGNDDIYNKIFNVWGFGEVLEKGRGVAMLFYGPPGTGKTLLAEVLARRLAKTLRIVTSAEIESSEPGGAERAMKAFFLEATKKNHLLLFDECDSLFFSRDYVGPILSAQVNCFLGELERFEGVCVMTTNNAPTLDSALERRLALKLEFPFPDEAARERIWQRMIAKPDAIAPCVDFTALARYELSGGEIKNAAISGARRAAYLKKERIELEDLLVGVTRELEGKKAFAEKKRLPKPRGMGGNSTTDYIRG